LAKRPPATKLSALPFGIGALHRRALRQGVFGGNRTWMYLGLVIWIPRFAWRFMARHEHTVARDVLEPGQFIRIEAFRKPSKSELKQANKAAKASK
jgi:hypothetical protein